jgi:hypothetical protein
VSTFPVFGPDLSSKECLQKVHWKSYTPKNFFHAPWDFLFEEQCFGIIFFLVLFSYIFFDLKST